MPTTRHRRNRAPAQRITPAAIEAFRTAERLGEFRDACLASDAMCTHEECNTEIEARRTLHRELAVRPWEASPLHVPEDGPLPDWTTNRSGLANGWRARELRRALLAATGD